MAETSNRDFQTQAQNLHAALASAGPGHESQVQALVGFLREKRSATARQVLRAEAHQLVAHLAELVDAAVQSIHDLALAEVGVEHGTRSPIALVATGGYGRRQLCPFSDVDIALVTSHLDVGGLDQLLKATHRLIVEVLQDGLGLEVGYAYRPVPGCAKLDHRTQTALLDARFAAGDQALFLALKQSLLASLDRLAYMQAKRAETEARRARFGDTPYHLEPDVKNSAGGLRDLQSLRWMAAARFGVEVPTALDELERRGVISHQDRESLLEAEAFLLRVRCWLHFTSVRSPGRTPGGHLDVLLRSKQEALAAEFDRLGEGDLASVQGLMSRYYECTATILDLTEAAVRQCLRAELDLGDGFVAAEGELRAARPDLFQQNPAALIGAFELAQRYRLRMAPDLRELVRASLHLVDEPLRSSPAAAERFRAILGATHGVADTLRSMWDIGLLPRYIPEIAGLEKLVPSDPTHQLAVGAHTLRAIANLEGIAALEGAAYDQLRGAYADIQHRDLLMLACLLHDAGKAQPESDHCEAGSQLAAEVTHRLGLSSPLSELVTNLVRKHLFLVRTARLQDITLPTTIAAFAEDTGSVSLLNMLYVLSYADTEAVGPGALTDVNRQQANDLHFRSL